MKITRRHLLTGSLAAAGLGSPLRAWTRHALAPRPVMGNEGEVIDTNVHLFPWPFRHLKYGEPEKLVAKLRRHRIRQAWVGSFESLTHKDIDGVNRRLVEVCARYPGFLLPFGAVNPIWPNWEEDLRRCHEVYWMPGIRLHPPYQGYDLGEPAFAQLLEAASRRGLIVQIGIRLEDNRVHHPKYLAPDLNPAPIVALLRDLPAARVQFLNYFGIVRGERLKTLTALAESSQVLFEIANLEGCGGLQKALAGTESVPLNARVPLERLAFGSHVPYFPLENALFKFMESRLSGTELRAIMAGNATRFLAGNLKTSPR